MKFTKEEAYKDLVAKLTAKGEKLNLSERSINEQLENLITLIANDEMEMSDFIEKVTPFIKTADANVRNDVSVGINEYKKNNPPKPNVEPIQTPKDDDVLADRLKALEEKLAASEKQNAINEKKSQLLNKIKEKGVKDEAWISDFLSEVNITEDLDVEAKAEHYVGIYNKMASFVDANITPRNAGGSGNDKSLQDFIKGASDYVKSQRLD